MVKEGFGCDVLLPGERTFTRRSPLRRPISDRIRPDSCQRLQVVD